MVCCGADVAPEPVVVKAAVEPQKTSWMFGCLDCCGSADQVEAAHNETLLLKYETEDVEEEEAVRDVTPADLTKDLQSNVSLTVASREGIDATIEEDIDARTATEYDGNEDDCVEHNDEDEDDATPQEQEQDFDEDYEDEIRYSSSSHSSGTSSGSSASSESSEESDYDWRTMFPSERERRAFLEFKAWNARRKLEASEPMMAEDDNTTLEGSTDGLSFNQEMVRRNSGASSKLTEKSKQSSRTSKSTDGKARTGKRSGKRKKKKRHHKKADPPVEDEGLKVEPSGEPPESPKKTKQTRRSHSRYANASVASSVQTDYSASRHANASVASSVQTDTLSVGSHSSWSTPVRRKLRGILKRRGVSTQPAKIDASTSMTDWNEDASVVTEVSGGSSKKRWLSRNKKKKPPKSNGSVNSRWSEEPRAPTPPGQRSIPDERSVISEVTIQSGMKTCDTSDAIAGDNLSQSSDSSSSSKPQKLQELKIVQPIVNTPAFFHGRPRRFGADNMSTVDEERSSLETDSLDMLPTSDSSAADVSAPLSASSPVPSLPPVPEEEESRVHSTASTIQVANTKTTTPRKLRQTKISSLFAPKEEEGESSDSVESVKSAKKSNPFEKKKVTMKPSLLEKKVMTNPIPVEKKVTVNPHPVEKKVTVNSSSVSRKVTMDQSPVEKRAVVKTPEPEAIVEESRQDEPIGSHHVSRSSPIANRRDRRRDPDDRSVFSEGYVKNRRPKTGGDARSAEVHRSKKFSSRGSVSSAKSTHRGWKASTRNLIN